MKDNENIKFERDKKVVTSFLVGLIFFCFTTGTWILLSNMATGQGR